MADTTTGESVDLDVEGIVFGIWDQRANATFVQNAVELISEFLLNRDVFDELEFYLPQLGHMIIHLGGDDTVLHSLDRLAVILCQASLHVALKLTFILKAAMEDYQEETASGEKNPSGNATLYMRCARLLFIVERSVIYGHPVVEKADHFSRSMSGFYEETGFRDFANKVLGSDDIGDEEVLTGKLLYKRRTRAFLMQRKVWKERWFKIEHRVLYCFHDSECKTLRRAINLKDCIVDDSAKSSHGQYFEVKDCASDCVFQLRASSDEEAAMWVATLKKVSTGVPRPVIAQQESMDSGASDTASPVTDGALLTPLQWERLNFFNGEQDFVRALTDICERLRFVDREVRGDELEREQRELKVSAHRSYLPLCKSTDTWRAILKVLPAEGHAFTTKARCPALMMFELEEHPMKMDVASYLFTDLSVADDLMVEVPSSLTSKNSVATAEEIPSVAVEKQSLFKRSVSKMTEEDLQDGKSETDAITPLAASIFHAPVKRLSVAAMDPSRAGAYRAAVTIREMSFKKESDEIRKGQAVSSPVSDDAGIREENIDIELEESGAEAQEAQEETKAWTTGSETFAEKTARLHETSSFSELKNWKLDGLIAKSNDDLRQEVFVIQLISFYEKIFKEANVDVLLYSYQILSTSKTTGLIQLIPDSISIDALKKQPSWPGTLRGHFEQSYGPVGSPAFETAMDNYVRSLAGYSIVTYLLALKDRHNGNIMMHRSGQLIHIDFGFVFGLAPGKQLSMEKAPWKFTVEIVDVLGGKGSAYYNKYMQLCADALRVARKHAAKVVSMMEILSYMSNYPAFKYNSNAINDFRGRLHMKTPDEKLPSLIQKLADRSYDHSGTNNYDTFQVLTNGIAK